MSSKIKLTNANGKTLTLEHNDVHLEDNVVDPLQTAYTINTVADFTAVPTGFKTVIVKDADRGGTFTWSATGTANDGTVFTGTTGYWNRQYDGAVNVKWFGNITSDSFRKASLICNSPYVDSGTYNIDNTYDLSNNLYHSLGDVTITTNTTIKVFNLAILNYTQLYTDINNKLPLNGKATDSDKLGGIDITSFSQLANNEDFTGAKTFSNSVVSIPNLPTTDPKVIGQLWNNAGVVTVSAG